MIFLEPKNVPLDWRPRPGKLVQKVKRCSTMVSPTENPETNTKRIFLHQN